MYCIEQLHAMYTYGDNMKDNKFSSQNGFHSEMFYQH